MSLLLTGAGTGQNFTTAFTNYYNKILAEGGSLTALEKTAINQWIIDIGNNYNEIDRAVILGVQNTIAKKVSVTNPLSALSSFVGSPTESSNGVVFNGTTQYIDTNYNQSTSSVKYTRNNSSFGLYLRKLLVDTSVNMGLLTGIQLSYINPNYTALGGLFTINAGSNTISAAQTSRGLFSAVRTGASASAGYKNGASVITGAVASVPLGSYNFYVGARNNAGTADLFSAQEVSFYYMGSGAVDQAVLYSATQTLGTTLGWAV